MLKTQELFDLSKTCASSLLSRCEYPWEALNRLKEYILLEGKKLPFDEFNEIEENVWVSKDVSISQNAVIIGPAIIGRRTEIRTGAFIRGGVIIGMECVIGNSCEIKNSIIFDCVQIPHFNYVGDSIVGYKAHMGAGAITSNIKSDKTLVSIRENENRYHTGLRKLGAMIGDGCEIGCNCVLNPGTVIGKNTNIYPLSSVRGTVDANCIYKALDNIVPKHTK